MLKVDNLKMHFPVRGNALPWRRIESVRAVDGVSFTLQQGETLGIVGESGCGKSTLGKAVMRLLQPTSGKVIFEGTDFLSLSARKLRLRRHRIQMVFQDPSSSLNPRLKVEQLLAEPMQIAGYVPEKIEQRISHLLEITGLREDHRQRYTHEFSGGQKQRICIARAIALDPALVVCDEAVSALDVSVQAQIINLLKKIQKEQGVGFLFISHDLRVIRQMAHNVAVMYLGKIVEYGPVEKLFESPSHPYTVALLSAIPDKSTRLHKPRIRISGDIPSPVRPPSGCRFRTRCPKAQELCATTEPPLFQQGRDHQVACHFPMVATGNESGRTLPSQTE